MWKENIVGSMYAHIVAMNMCFIVKTQLKETTNEL